MSGERFSNFMRSAGRISDEGMYSNNLRAGGDAAQAQLWLYDEKNVYFPQQRYAQRQRQHHVYGSDSSCDLDEDASATEILVEKHNCFVSDLVALSLISVCLPGWFIIAGWIVT